MFTFKCDFTKRDIFLGELTLFFCAFTEKDGGLSAGAIAGIVIGCLIVLIAGPAGGYFVFKKLWVSKVYDF